MNRISQAILPAYVLLCLVIGGSSQAIWGNALLQIGAVGLLSWALLTRDPTRMMPHGGRLLVIAGLLGVLFALQLTPFPPSIWMTMPGRQFIADGFALLGMQPPWRPISLSPYDTISTAMTLLPPLAVLVAMLRLRAWNAEWMFVAIVLGAAISIILGVLQVTGGEAWYLYRRTNIGVAVGTFANGNHFATLLLVAVPVLAALAAGRWRSEGGSAKHAFTVALAAAAAAVLAIGFLLNRSAAALLLGTPVALATGLLALRPSPQRVRQGLVVLALLLAAGGAAVALAGKYLPGSGNQASIETRAEFWSKSARAVKDQALTGSGFGTFEQVYRRYEDPGFVDRWYVNHAHNDFLEIAVEGGIAAVVLLLIFLFWWVWRSREAWFSPASTAEQKAAAVASAAILLHSAFDYPLRTAGIAAVMAVCLALLAGALGTPGTRRGEEREPVRHAAL